VEDQTRQLGQAIDAADDAVDDAAGAAGAAGRTRESTGDRTGNRGGERTAADPEERVREAVEAAAETKHSGDLGRPGRPLNTRSPFFIGMTGAAGVAATIAVVELLLKARSVLLLVVVALFIAAGLDPLVRLLTRKGLPRWSSVVLVLLLVLCVIAGFIAAAVPPLAAQTTALVHEMPNYMHQLQDHNSTLGKLNAKYHVQQRLTSLLSSKGTSLIGGVVGAGELVISTFSSVVLVLVLTVYFLADMERTKLFIYRLIPQSRRERGILLGEEIFTKVGGYVFGNVLTSLIAGVGTFVWLLAWGLPYPLLLGLMVALFDLIPVIGSWVGGIIVTLIALTHSLIVAVATLAFYVLYKLAEDYFIVPRVMGRTVQVPALVSLIAVVLGGVLLGIVGALIAIPVAAAISLLLREITFRRLDKS
jgi:predicted PurR-regulated permease PerM